MRNRLISIHTLRVEGDHLHRFSIRAGLISIHTLRVEGDLERGQYFYFFQISIHTLRVEGDSRRSSPSKPHLRFQSTPSAWRVTDLLLHPLRQRCISIHTLRVEGDPVQVVLLWGIGLISIHTLRVEGDHRAIQLDGLCGISIHTLRVEGDGIDRSRTIWYVEFQSTPSAWRVTYREHPVPVSRCISIHTLRVEGDDCRPAEGVLRGISIHTLRVEGDA